MNNILRNLISDVNSVKSEAVDEVKKLGGGLLARTELYVSTNWHPLIAGAIVGLVIGVSAALVM